MTRRADRAAFLDLRMREALSMVEAIRDGELLAAEPVAEADRYAQAAGLALLEMLEARLRDALDDDEPVPLRLVRG